MKKCSKCKIEKEQNEFKKHCRHKDGLYSWCKICVSNHRKKPEILEQSRNQRNNHRLNNIDKYRAYAIRFKKTEKGIRSVLNSAFKNNYGITIDKYNDRRDKRIAL